MTTTIESKVATRRATSKTTASKTAAVKPRYSAPAFNIIPPIEYIVFGFNKCFHSYLHVGNRENYGIEHNFDQSLEIRYSGV